MVFVISALRGGGAEKFVLNLYKAMEKYQGYECHIVAIEKAKYSPPLEMAFKIAEVFGVELSAVFTYVPEQAPKFG